MKEYIIERSIEHANFIIKNKVPIREVAKKFAVSSSTVHKDITERLVNIDPSLANEVK